MAITGEQMIGEERGDLQALDLAVSRPPRPLSLPVPLASGKLLTTQALLAGWSLREAGGVTSASSSGGAQANNVSIPAVAGSIAVVTGFEVTGAGATAGSDIVVTLTGVVGGPLSYVIAVPTGAAVGIPSLLVAFSEPLQATGAGVAITLNVPNFGAGNTNAAAVIHGGYLAQVDLIDGGDTNGQLLVSITMLPNGLDHEVLADGALWAANGILFSLTSGTVRGTVWAKY